MNKQLENHCEWLARYTIKNEDRLEDEIKLLRHKIKWFKATITLLVIPYIILIVGFIQTAMSN